MRQVVSRYTILNDEQLFLLVKSGDSEAFRELYDRCKPSLVDSASRKLQCRATAEDIVHDLFLNVYARCHTIDLSVSVKAYLHTAVQYKVHNTIRSRITRQNYVKRLLRTRPTDDDCFNAVELKECQESIDVAMNALPPQCKKVFELSRSFDYSYKDISNRLGISQSTVEKHVSKALRALRARVL